MTMVPRQRNGSAIAGLSRHRERQAMREDQAVLIREKRSGIQTPLYDFIF